MYKRQIFGYWMQVSVNFNSTKYVYVTKSIFVDSYKSIYDIRFPYCPGNSSILYTLSQIFHKTSKFDKETTMQFPLKLSELNR